MQSSSGVRGGQQGASDDTAKYVTTVTALEGIDMHDLSKTLLGT